VCEAPHGLAVSGILPIVLVEFRPRSNSPHVCRGSQAFHGFGRVQVCYNPFFKLNLYWTLILGTARLFEIEARLCICILSWGSSLPLFCPNPIRYLDLSPLTYPLISIHSHFVLLTDFFRVESVVWKEAHGASSLTTPFLFVDFNENTRLH
jgi:hypothetical protein